MGQTVRGTVPEVFTYDAFFQRYGWNYAVMRRTPEPLLEELQEVMIGETEGLRLMRARQGQPGHTPIDAGLSETTAAYAARKGLLPPPGGWPAPKVDDG